MKLNVTNSIIMDPEKSKTTAMSNLKQARIELPAMHHEPNLTGR